MNLPPARIDYIIERLQECIGIVIDNFQDGGEEVEGSGPDLLADAMFRLLDVLKRLDHLDDTAYTRFDAQAYQGAPSREDETEVSALADYGIQLLADLSTWASRLELEHSCNEIETLAFSLALWVSERGGELHTLSPVVNSLAALANSTRDPHELEQLFNAMSQIVQAAGMDVTEAPREDGVMDPWRILVLNRAIVATRTCRPALMREAFDSLIEHLPDEAAAFFREGMEQMDIVGYPDEVKKVMSEYAALWSAPRMLH